ncbi:MAG: hypothetical protein II425_03255 [Oscillospiraceae bacterium]|nr:hypothetical protein [Oscillospiraceae bacterium]MBQ2329869.1 hypothetical protein [Oscillospiraceae bacterium]MBQ5567657.1 hypothetical protein [Oscillospiraceae bacterium]
MWTPDYFVRLVELPPTIDGTVVPNDDGSFDIYINSRSPEEKRRAWLEHELEHIRRDHFYRDEPVAALEAEAGGVSVSKEGGKRGSIPLFSSPDEAAAYYLSGGSGR